MVFETSVVSEDWKFAVVVPLHTGKGERNECRNYRGINLSSVVGKMYAVILVDRVHRVSRDLIDEEQGDFITGRDCVDQIFTLKQIGDKAQEKNVKCMWVIWI